MIDARTSTCPFAVPSFPGDLPDSSSAPEIKAAYFDEELRAWVLSRYADVLAAFRHPELVPASAKSRSIAVPDEKARIRMRVQTKAALSRSRLHAWQKMLAEEAKTLVAGLPLDRCVDLVSEVAQPLCLRLAVTVTAADPQEGGRLQRLARLVSAAAADPYDAEAGERAKAAEAELRGGFRTGPEPLRDSGFVALCCTLPALIQNMWFALLQHPRLWKRLHAEPFTTAKAVEELLRYAGLTRLLFRRALSDLDLNGLAVRKGDRVVLCIAAANRDPERFPHPGQLDWQRPGNGHVALGAGAHSCVGASLIRMASITLTRALVESFCEAEIAGPVRWNGGAIFRAPAQLPVRLEVPENHAVAGEGGNFHSQSRGGRI